MIRRCVALAALVLMAGACKLPDPPVPTSESVRSGTTEPNSTTTGRPTEAEGPYPVVSVVDGDTIKVNRDGQTVTVRIIGMDTPETKDPRKPVQCFGREASAKAHELLDGRTVWLEPDPTQDTRDKYGRVLAYVWTDQTLYELTMISQGFAHEYTYRLPYHYQAEFKAAEREAREGQRGFWSPSTCSGDTEKPA